MAQRNKKKKEELIGFPLTKEQKKHLPSLRWLFGRLHRAEGRSTLLAYVYIEKCLREMNTVRVIDHHGTRFADMHLLMEINRIIEAKQLPIRINGHQIEITHLHSL